MAGYQPDLLPVGEAERHAHRVVPGHADLRLTLHPAQRVARASPVVVVALHHEQPLAGQLVYEPLDQLP